MNRLFKFEHGTEVTDVITGSRGFATGRTDYITGCKQILVQPKQSKGSFVDSRWFDEDRLQPTGKSISLKVTNDGPDKPAPRK